MPCTYMKTHRHARARSHTIIYTCRRVCTHAHICTHRGTSVQRTPSILNPDPGLLSVFTCKWSTTICGPFRLLCPSSRLGLGKRAGSQMGGPHQMGSRGYGAKRSKEREEREGRGCLPGSHWNSRDSHISWKWSMVCSPSLTGEQRERCIGLSKRLEGWDQSRHHLRWRECSVMCGLQIN